MKGPKGKGFLRSCFRISSVTRAIKDEKRTVNKNPHTPRNAPTAAISLMSPPPRLSFPVAFWKNIAVNRNRKNPDKAPIPAEIQLISVFGKNENINPIAISGSDNLSGIIRWYRSIKNMINPNEINIAYLKKTRENWLSWLANRNIKSRGVNNSTRK